MKIISDRALLALVLMVMAAMQFLMYSAITQTLLPNPTLQQTSDRILLETSAQPAPFAERERG